jgi:hypothetical protein
MKNLTEQLDIDIINMDERSFCSQYVSGQKLSSLQRDLSNSSNGMYFYLEYLINFFLN